MVDVVCTDGERRIVLSFPIADPGVEQLFTATGDFTTQQLIGFLSNNPLSGQGGLRGQYFENETAFALVKAMEIIGMPAQIPPEWEADFIDARAESETGDDDQGQEQDKEVIY